jgi:hypothetical protein
VIRTTPIEKDAGHKSEPMNTASDIRPSHADLDALLASIPLTVETRRAVIDALGRAALLWGSTPLRAAAAADPKGRLSVGEVGRALEKFDELTQAQVMAVLSSVGALA